MLLQFFLFWILLPLLKNYWKRLYRTKYTSIIGAGMAGALAYTFSDSFWFSAVEGEVYAMSSFFTAIVFWASLKWMKSMTMKEIWLIDGYY